MFVTLGTFLLVLSIRYATFYTSSKVTFTKRHLTVYPVLVLLSMYVPFEQGYKSAQPFQRNRIWISDKTPPPPGR